MIKKCANCNAEFTAYKNSKYCSSKCKEQGYKETQHNYYIKNIKPKSKEETHPERPNPSRSLRFIRDDFERRVAEDDTHSRLLDIASKKGNKCREYWEYFKLHHMENYPDLTCTVNGVDVREDYFIDFMMVTVASNEPIIIHRNFTSTPMSNNESIT